MPIPSSYTQQGFFLQWQRQCGWVGFDYDHSLTFNLYAYNSANEPITLDDMIVPPDSPSAMPAAAAGSGRMTTDPDPFAPIQREDEEAGDAQSQDDDPSEQ